jgi:hypothetical protein
MRSFASDAWSKGDLVLEAARRLTSQNIGEAVVAAELFETSRTLRRDAELYCFFFDLLYEPAGRAIEDDIARNYERW